MLYYKKIAKNWKFCYLEGNVMPLTPLNHLCFRAYMFVYTPTTYEPLLSLSLYLSVAPSLCCLSVCLSLSVSVCLSVWLSVCRSLSLSVCLSVSLFDFRCGCLSLKPDLVIIMMSDFHKILGGGKT